MRTELVLGAAFCTLIRGASDAIEINADVQTAGVSAAIGAAGGVVYSQLEESIRISLR